VSTVCYTSIYGGYDVLKPHVDHPDIDRWICYTDDPAKVCSGWETIVEERPFSHPRLSAKWRKCHPPDVDQSIWVDGSIDCNNPDYYTEVLHQLDHGDMVMFPHPDRTSLLAEAYVSEMMPKYHGLRVLEQAEHYIENWGWPDDTLWASTTIGRNHTPAVLQLGAAWFAENEHWTYQDQISLPPLIVRYGIDVAPLGYSLWRNPWFGLAGHASQL
jgi:hypothetical protein